MTYYHYYKCIAQRKKCFDIFKHNIKRTYKEIRLGQAKPYFETKKMRTITQA